jgi:hypothetical protein
MQQDPIFVGALNQQKTEAERRSEQPSQRTESASDSRADQRLGTARCTASRNNTGSDLRQLERLGECMRCTDLKSKRTNRKIASDQISANKTRKIGLHQATIGTTDFSLKSKDIRNTEVTVFPPSFDY